VVNYTIISFFLWGEGGIILNLPRLIIADEQRPGKIMSGLLIAAILKKMGYKLKLFLGNVDEISLRLLQLLCEQPVTLLDPTLCDGRANLRWLFQQAASPDCLNLIITNLGGKWTEDSPFRIPKECGLLAEWLESEIVPVLYSDSSSTLTVRTLNEVVAGLQQNGSVAIRAVLFRSVLNNREYELLDREVGRQFTIMPMGSISQKIDRNVPILTDLFFQEAAKAVFPIKSAYLQLMNMNYQVNWMMFSALANLNSGWLPQARLCDPITDVGKVNIAVVRHETLTLGGDGTEHLIRALGCNVVEVPLEGSIVHNVPIHGVYIPHGPAYMTLPKFFSNIYLKTMLNRASGGNSFMLAEGGAAPILGDKITLPEGAAGGGMGRGFAILPYNSLYISSSPGVPQKNVAIRRKVNPLISGSQECVWGYSSPNLSLESKSPGGECWETLESLDGRLSGVDGWCKGRILSSAMKIEPWSAPASFCRWLEG
jgi:cobyrinic acid a,c-diamide synthase